jgi:hypothetical protein
MKLIENLNAINDCKESIKTALINKGVDMTDVKFEDYAGKIDALQFESGDTPSVPTPTPSVDYIYSNGYLTGGSETNDVITFTPYEIVLGDNGNFVIDLTCPEEIPGYEGGTYYDIIFTVDIPSTYQVSKFEYYDRGTTTYYDRELKTNPRHNTVIRDGVEYNSYVRKMTDNKDCGSEYIAYEPLQYRITINKK